MAVYTVELDGEQFDIEGPDDASEEELRNQAIQFKQGGESPSPAQMPAEEGPSKTHRVMKKVADLLPTAGAMAGGTVGGLGGAAFGMGFGGVPGAAAGAGLGAAGGTAAKQMLLRYLGESEGVPQSAGEAAKAIGIAGAKDAALTFVGGKALQGAGKALKFGKKLAFSPKAEEVAQMGKEKLLDIAEKGAEKLGMARGAEASAKAGLIGAEEEAGLHFATSKGFEKYIGNPQKVAGFIEKVSPLIKQGPEQLAQTVDSKTLQLLRKVAQESEKSSAVSDIAKAQLREIKDITAQAMGRAEPAVGEQLGRFREAGKVVKEIPGQIKEQLTKQKLQTGEDVLGAKKLERTRKLIKAGLAGGAAYLGARTLFK